MMGTMTHGACSRTHASWGEGDGRRVISVLVHEAAPVGIARDHARAHHGRGNQEKPNQASGERDNKTSAAVPAPSPRSLWRRDAAPVSTFGDLRVH